MHKFQNPNTNSAVRIAVLGAIAFALFGIIFFRLWYLQVLSGSEYVNDAKANRVRKVTIEAPRGDIVDRHGTVLVDTRIAPVIQIEPNQLLDRERQLAAQYSNARARSERARLAAGKQLKRLEGEIGNNKPTKVQKTQLRRLKRHSLKAMPIEIPSLPHEERKMVTLFKRLGNVIGMSATEIHRRSIQGIAEQPYANITVKVDVARPAFNYIKERQERFPGVVAEKRYLRYYPHKELGAQLFGALREISPEELKKHKYHELAQGARIGKDGIEETFDHALRGRDGYTNVVVNASGKRDDSRPMQRVDPVQGHQLKLTLDLPLQRAAHKALKRVSASGSGSGAYVALDPRNGDVLALGSYPSFDANLFAKPISPSRYDRLISHENGAPLFNRAIAASYPPGSIFKPVTALASLHSGVTTSTELIFDGGSFKLDKQSWRNARGAAYGSLSMVRALGVSSDVYFYTLGYRANARGAIIQRWARKLSMGEKTGIDIPGEFAGLVPDRRWRDAGYSKYMRCVKRSHVRPQTLQALHACGGIERSWSVGDNIHLAIGQGDLQTTPLQMATAYAVLANGGRIVTPHLGKAIGDSAGLHVEEIPHAHGGKLNANQDHLATVRAGLKASVREPGGTSYHIFKGFVSHGFDIYAKTGTVERAGQPDQSWYACWVNHPTKPIVLVTTVEGGGFGSETAAPASLEILNHWYGLKDESAEEAAAKRKEDAAPWRQ